MRILIYSYNYYPEPTGIAPLMTELAEGLVARGHQVRVIAAMPSYPSREIHEGYRGKLYLTEERNGVRIHRNYIRVRNDPTIFDRLLLEGTFVGLSLFSALRGRKPDVIFMTVPPLPAFIPALVLRRIYGCPLILNIQIIVSKATEHVGMITRPWMLEALRSFEKWTYRKSDAIIVITNEFVDSLAQDGIEPSKIVCIPNWADTVLIRPLPKKHNEFRRLHHLQQKFVVLYAGNIGLTEGLETAIEAAARLVHIPAIRFMIVGDEKAIEKLKALANARDADNIVFLPFQPREQLAEMLAAADVGLVLQKRNVSVYNMPSKIPVFLAAGLPIIASVPLATPASRTVGESRSGIVIEPEDPQCLVDSIVGLYKDPDRLSAFSQLGRQFALSHFSKQQALTDYESAFLLATSGRSRNEAT
jgi:colanic acid biosynthesis glycosyl transferase WcaI